MNLHHTLDETEEDQLNDEIEESEASQTAKKKRSLQMGWESTKNPRIHLYFE